ncbi:DNA-binding response regulator [Polaribacter sejongensis]|uniref:DNA-binding response regulator n=1 Tax=Polaribacter sejongensis TaxID=985043 RepID=A0AAJ1VH19_9FLAO|nr:MULTISPECIES: response regulator transcription factor [Polaribacter]AUC23036.1 DNA-binding response regulator [Polaribacter sejongensis]MDN3620368.1 response regulator transcription factor [Polaribacter undariae]UWD32769.1 response regulator transcription factor [Polaribacter undariae]
MITKSKISIVVADDHPMLLKGLFEELTNNGYNVVGKAENGLKALELILKLKPTLAILDVDMPFLSGFEVVEMAKGKKVETEFIIQTFHKEVSYIAQAKRIQIKGYLLKEDSFLAIEKCIKAVINKGECFSESIQNTFENESNGLQNLQFLSPSEIVILKHISNQTSTNTIAEMLCVSVRTIEKHRSNIISKLDLEHKANSLTNWAFRNKISIVNL